MTQLFMSPATVIRSNLRFWSQKGRASVKELLTLCVMSYIAAALASVLFPLSAQLHPVVALPAVLLSGVIPCVLVIAIHSAAVRRHQDTIEPLASLPKQRTNPVVRSTVPASLFSFAAILLLLIANASSSFLLPSPAGFGGGGAKGAFAFLALFFIIFSLPMFLLCAKTMFAPSEPHTNSYGPNPHEVPS